MVVVEEVVAVLLQVEVLMGLILYLARLLQPLVVVGVLEYLDNLDKMVVLVVVAILAAARELELLIKDMLVEMVLLVETHPAAVVVALAQ
jgi:hypothetical protein